MSENTLSKQRWIKDIFTRALLGLSFVVFLKWLVIGIEGNFTDAPHYFLYFFCFTFLIALAIRNILPRISGVIGFVFSLWFSVFVFGSAFGGMSGWVWYEYMITFIGGPLGVLTLVMSIRMVISKK